MDTTEYRVELDLFSGPLDLLLYLVRRDEVDILDLPIARIAADFQRYLELLEFLDLDVVGDFVVMASTLVEIKSRFVLPRPEPEEEPEPEIDADPRSELVRQLLEYRKFKDAARALEQRAAEWQERYPRLTDERPEGARDPAADRIREVELWDLVSALGRVLERKQVQMTSRIRYADTPISVFCERIHARVRVEGRVAFSSLFDDCYDRSRIVGIFLALLELLRKHRCRAEQPIEFREIWITPWAKSADCLPESPADGVTETMGSAE